ncbi:hypothetical protein [Mycobacterium sp. TY815]|uniref:hypothetical protein n=1 Tax=Mycobacterium sp. TY815 TaxID=3050581 RepID=UPI00274257D6|nr:hypothetical protein [Mycobacterium sp. TY815]MDP7707474.1 hypothetical protein [Mycobacterium sp. TY815]
MTSSFESEDEFAAKVINFGRHDDEVGGAPSSAGITPFEPTADGAEDPMSLSEEDIDHAGERPQERFDHRVAWRFGGLVACGLVAALVGAVVLYSHGSPTPHAGGRSLSEPQAVAVAKTSATPSPAVTGGDRPLPYTADALGSCAPGSSAAQTMSGSDPRNAFVCVRAGGDGQTILIDLGHPYVITAIAIEPGWVKLDASGVSQWSQHRVVTLVQYVFDHDPTSLVLQDTRNVHGEAVQPIKHQVASTIQVLIRQTSRPPTQATSAPSAPASPPGGGMFGIFGSAAPGTPADLPALSGAQPTGTAGDTNSDPVDASFAIGSLQVIGREAL